MSPELGAYILAVIQALLPGGLDAFREMEGQITMVPAGENSEILLYSKEEMPVEVRNALEALFKKLSLSFRFVTSLNFGDMSELDVIKAFDEVTRLKADQIKLKEFLLAPNKLAILLVIADDNISHKEIDDFLGVFRSSIPGIRRVYVVHDGNKLLRREYSSEEIDRALAVIAPSSTRTTVIKDEDILDLRIALETCETIDDFISKL